jgi:hypothetical protein
MTPRQPEALLNDSVVDHMRSRLTAVMLKDDPVGYAQQTLGVYLWSKQKEIVLALESHNRVAVRSCHDSGKSFTAAVIAARWLDTHPIGQARVITTAPTNTQVRGILWVEINQLHERAGLPGRVNQTEWWIGSYMAGIGRKPADYRPEAFQGLHARWPLIIVDEAGGVSASLIDAAETLATNINAKMLLIGNPDDPQSLFADIHNHPEQHGYHVIKISAWDTPNFTAEGPALLANPDPNAQMLPEVLLSPAWVEGRRKAWGEDHPFWMSKIEAEFPSQDSNAIVRIADIVKCRVPIAERMEGHDVRREPGLADPSSVVPFPLMPVEDMNGTQDFPSAVAPDGLRPSVKRGVASAHERGGDDGPPSQSPPRTPLWVKRWPQTLGVDVAGSEQGDETVMRLVTTSAAGLGVVDEPSTLIAAGSPHQRLALLPTSEWRCRSGDPSIVADSIMSAILQSGATKIMVDSIGVGFGVIGLVRERLVQRGIAKAVKVIGVNGASKATKPDLYGNLRAELWWTVGRVFFHRGWIDTSEADNLEDLEAQLLMPRYKISKGRIYVEAKEDIKGRLGRSPDNADAFMYALANAVTDNAGIATIARPPQMSIDPRTMASRATVSTANRMIYQSHQRYGTSPMSPSPMR